jgi:transposase-like protein
MEWEPQTLIEVIRFFSDPKVCFDYMLRLRWPDCIVRCPTCDRDDPRFLANEQRWECRARHPRKKFSLKTNTIFEDSPIKLDKWLTAMWLLVNAKNGISSMEIHRSIGVTQKTAWFMLQRLRLAMQTGTFMKLGGTVEVDETFIGGKARNMHKEQRQAKIHGRGGVGKAIVMGLLERHGKVSVAVVPDRSSASLQPRVRAIVKGGAELMTDALPSYKGLDAEYVHGVIDHAEAYVDGKVHTNGIENFWALLKRMIGGTYVSVEPYHLFRYLDEESFRFNEREATDARRFRKAMAGVTGKRLTYKKLTGKLGLDSGKGVASASL